MTRVGLKLLSKGPIDKGWILSQIFQLPGLSSVYVWQNHKNTSSDMNQCVYVATKRIDRKNPFLQHWLLSQTVTVKICWNFFLKTEKPERVKPNHIQKLMTLKRLRDVLQASEFNKQMLDRLSTVNEFRTWHTLK